jgi:hypothetical protein
MTDMTEGCPICHTEASGSTLRKGGMTDMTKQISVFGGYGRGKMTCIQRG